LDGPEPDGYLDATEAELFEALQNAVFPEEIYDGPGAYTADELAEDQDYHTSTVERRAQDRVQEGLLVEVKVRRVVKSRNVTKRAWVLREVYDRYNDTRGARSPDANQSETRTAY